MFQEQMKWCDKNIEKLCPFFNEGNQITSIPVYWKIIIISLVILTFNDTNMYEENMLKEHNRNLEVSKNEKCKGMLTLYNILYNFHSCE